ncbi:unnamed protein product [Lymnaea stagnalis]|uniref:Uncharacterized protein n=1 Tax=Lymnaea stagnalis TaxID=6523 RepID=A0AAV2HVF6_LYMST
MLSNKVTTTQLQYKMLPKRPEFEEYTVRLNTFNEKWQVDFLKPELVARAGLWYIGEEDRVRCYFCGGGLRRWEPKDDPLKEHKRLFPTCGFLTMKLYERETDNHEGKATQTFGSEGNQKSKL